MRRPCDTSPVSALPVPEPRNRLLTMTAWYSWSSSLLPSPALRTRTARPIAWRARPLLHGLYSSVPYLPSPALALPTPTHPSLLAPVLSVALGHHHLYASCVRRSEIADGPCSTHMHQDKCFTVLRDSFTYSRTAVAGGVAPAQCVLGDDRRAPSESCSCSRVLVVSLVCWLCMFVV